MTKRTEVISKFLPIVQGRVHTIYTVCKKANIYGKIPPIACVPVRLLESPVCTLIRALHFSDELPVALLSVVIMNSGFHHAIYILSRRNSSTLKL